MVQKFVNISYGDKKINYVKENIFIDSESTQFGIVFLKNHIFLTLLQLGVQIFNGKCFGKWGTFPRE